MGRTQLFCRRKLACRLPRYIHIHTHQQHMDKGTTTASGAASSLASHRGTNQQVPLFFLFPPRLGEKSAVELPVPTRTGAAGESHGRRYTVALRTWAPPCSTPPKSTLRYRYATGPCRHMWLSFSLAKGYIGGRGERASGRAREWDASAASDPLPGKFTRPGRGGGQEG